MPAASRDPRVLLIDNTVDPPSAASRALGPDFRRHIPLPVEARRGPQRDLPGNLDAYTHIILSGSKTPILDDSPWVRELLDLARKAWERRIPMLGVCFGHQIIARMLGGMPSVSRSTKPEIGWVEVSLAKASRLLNGLPERFTVFESHFDEVIHVPDGAFATASSPRCAVQAYEFPDRPVFGVQFHPERDFDEGQEALLAHLKKKTPKEYLFLNPPNNKNLRGALENVANTVFGNFLRAER